MNSYFGDEYPAAITVNGVRMPLVSERRWTRSYATEDRNLELNEGPTNLDRRHTMTLSGRVEAPWIRGLTAGRSARFRHLRGLAPPA